MTRSSLLRASRGFAFALSGALVLLLGAPLVALALAAPPGAIGAGVRHPAFTPALWLSFRTTLVSLLVILVCGTPLAFWLSGPATRVRRAVGVLVELPVVIPPAVIGVALLMTFGRQGLLGQLLTDSGISIPFTWAAVVIAQVVVSAPLYIQTASAAFRKLDPDTLLVARTLGASAPEAFLRIAIPVSLPGLIAAASLAWTRSLGEFGATMLFAGNLVGATQTMPLAIFTALESDTELAVTFSLVLAALSALVLVLLRLRLRPLGTGEAGSSR